MKNLYALLLLSITFLGQAQVSDISVTDCNNNTNSIYNVMGSGKVLMVVSDGLDCSICKSKAPGIQSFAASHQTKVEVWGAMTYLYNNSILTCNSVNNWVSTYSWTNIFTFIDSNRVWFKNGTPRYTVYNPADSSVAYVGVSETDAMNKALELSATIGVKNFKVEDIYINNLSGGVEIHNLPPTSTRLQLSSLTGKLLKDQWVMPESGRVTLTTVGNAPGIYLLNIQNRQGLRTVRKIYVN